MAKKPGGASKTPKKPGAVWASDYICSSRGCGGQVHTLCVDAPKRPADDVMLVYVCPVTRKPTGFRFGDLDWKHVDAIPAGSIVIRPKR
jgi:hypothetical protein